VPSSRQIKAVLFDLDDTLIDWSKKSMSAGSVSRRHVDKIHYYLIEQGHKLPDCDAFYTLFNETIVAAWTEAKKTWSGVNFERVVRDTLIAAQLEINEINMHDVLVAYDWQPVPGIVPYPETLMVLATLKDAGYKLGLITNSMQPMWMRDIELNAYGIMPFLDVRVTSGDTGYMKPHPYIYLSALKQIGIEPQEAVFVGDRPGNDIIGANKVGMTSVWIDPPHLDYDLKGVEPHYRITQLQQLLPVIDALSKVESTPPYLPKSSSQRPSLQG
jgi:HAD superfamily hydrolase (TIGR01662 family)